MPCLVGLLALVFPRLAIVLVVIFSDYIGDAYQTSIWPLLGFIFMPLTTLAWAWAVHAGRPVDGFHLVIVVVAALIDLGIIGGGASNRQVRRYVVVREDR
jgi:hypothetical protein